MISRSILAAVLAVGTTGAALAEVQVKTPGASITAPSGPVDLNVNVGSKSMPTDAWIGRPVYSIDNKNIGEVAAIMGDQVYADIGGFLGLGETRVLLSLEQIASVKADRIDLTITEAEADKLPDVDATRSRKR